MLMSTANTAVHWAVEDYKHYLENHPKVRLPLAWSEFCEAVARNNPDVKCYTCGVTSWLSWREGYCKNHTKNTQVKHDRDYFIGE